jgi:D-alanyl-D-alanine carboxypeptidase
LRAPQVARKVLWLNTNRLLESDRFECFGFKTGITNAAGGCLVRQQYTLRPR